MDLDTIIYIIAVIVIFIVSLFGQNKKKKNMPIQSDKDNIVYSLNDFEKILQRKEQFQQELESIKNSTEEVEADDLLLEDNDEIIKIKDNIKKEKHIEKEKISDKDEKEDGFDLNSAIIYSSILERKKFRH